MTTIAPAILTETLDEYQALITAYSPFAERVHIDITDGEFAQTFTLGADQLTWPEQWQVDIHAMVARPSEYVDKLIALKPHTIIFHVEASEDITPIVQQIKQAGIRAGVALLKKTVPKNFQDLIELADYVLVFCGNLGEYGGTADLMQLEKVRLIRNISPEAEIGWDGGANDKNAFTLAQGGVNVINVGGAMKNAADPTSMYNTIKSEANKQGII